MSSIRAVYSDLTFFVFKTKKVYHSKKRSLVFVKGCLSRPNTPSLNPKAQIFFTIMSTKKHLLTYLYKSLSKQTFSYGCGRFFLIVY